MPETNGKDYNDHDVMFVQMMIEHHERALDMARMEWQHGKDQKMKDMALKVFTAQKEEIEILQKWMADNNLPNIESSPVYGGM